MTAGFQVVGSHGLLQIDERYTSLGLRAKGSMSISGPATVVVTDVQTPMLAISAPSAPVLLGGASQSGSTVTYTLHSGIATTALTWWVFDKMVPSVVGSHGAGLQVFTADGQCAFDSTTPPMRIAGLARMPDAPGGGAFPPAPGSLSGPAGAYAAFLSHPRVFVGDGGTVNWFADGVQTSSTGCVTGQVNFRKLPPQASFGTSLYMQDRGGLLFLVDVTGL